jgi:hypothetical protein
MEVNNDYFDEIFFSECFFEKIEFDNNSLKILASNIGFTEKHPFYKRQNLTGSVYFSESKYVLSFWKVRFSRRTVIEYKNKEENNEAGSPKEIINISDNYESEGEHSFVFAGETLEPPAWIEWEIKARAFTIVKLT